MNQTRDMNKEKYQFGDNQLIQYQVLWTNIIRVVWLTVRRIINLIWELKGYLRSNPDIDLLIKKIWLYCGAHKHFKQLNLLSACNVVSGKKVGCVTLNPLVLGTISGTGLLLKSTMEFKIISKKSSHHCVCRLEKNTSWFAILCERQTIRRSKLFDSAKGTWRYRHRYVSSI